MMLWLNVSVSCIRYSKRSKFRPKMHQNALGGRYWGYQKFITFPHSRHSHIINGKLISLCLAYRDYCKFTGDEFQQKNTLETIIKHIEYGLQGLNDFSTHCMYFFLADWHQPNDCFQICFCLLLSLLYDAVQ